MPADDRFIGPEYSRSRKLVKTLAWYLFLIRRVRQKIRRPILNVGRRNVSLNTIQSFHQEQCGA